MSWSSLGMVEQRRRLQHENSRTVWQDLFFYRVLLFIRATVQQYMQIKLDDEEYQIYRDEAVQLRFSVTKHLRTLLQLTSYASNGRDKLLPECVESIKLPSCRTLLASSKRSEATVALPEDTC